MSAQRKRPATTRGTGTPSQAALDTLQRDLQELGLSGYAARVLLAVVQLGSGTAGQLARLASIPRTSVYPVLEELRSRQVVQQLPGRLAVWSAPPADEILDRLYAAEEEHLHGLRTRLEQSRHTLAAIVPESPSLALPYVHLISGAAQMRSTYEHLLARARVELLMFTRPPYAWRPGPNSVNQAVLDMLSRGVRARVLYQADFLRGPDAEALLQEIEAYHEAGVEARVVDELPVKLVIVDRNAVTVVMPDPAQPHAAYPTSLMIEHAGFAAIQADAFEVRWSTGRPFAAARRLDRSRALGETVVRAPLDT